MFPRLARSIWNSALCRTLVVWAAGTECWSEAVGLFDQLPDFAYNEILAPPPAWTLAGPYPDGSVFVPIQQRKRLGQHHIDITPGTHVLSRDGEIGRVEEIELDPITGELDAFWVRGGGIFAHDMRIPAEWVERADESAVYVAATKVDIETGLGPQSRALTTARAGS